MHCEEMPPNQLPAGWGDANPSTGRSQYRPGWLRFVEPWVEGVCGHGARLDAMVAFDARGPLAALPLVRVASTTPRPFPYDLHDTFFGVWMRNRDPTSRGLKSRAVGAEVLRGILRMLNHSRGSAIVVHAPLASVSEALWTPRSLGMDRAAILRALFVEVQRTCAREGRGLFVPRVDERDGLMLGAVSEFTGVPSYPNAELRVADEMDRRTRGSIRRNARQLERAGVRVERTVEPPAQFPFERLFRETNGRHPDPATRLDNQFFGNLAGLASGVTYLLAYLQQRPVGFVVALDHGGVWEAFKCGVDRDAASPAPVYLDLLFGQLPIIARSAGSDVLELGPGALEVKAHYGARYRGVSAFFTLPDGYRLGRTFERYCRRVGDGIRKQFPTHAPATSPSSPEHVARQDIEIERGSGREVE